MNSQPSKNSKKLNHLNQKNFQDKKQSKKFPKLNIAQRLPAYKSKISDLNILSKNSNMTKIKTYEIKSDKQVIFLLSFEIIEEKMKISVKEKVKFSQNKYENYYSLEDFIKLNKFFNIFNNIQNLLYKFEQLKKNECFAIEQKDKNILSLFIIFPIEHLDKIEILLPLKDSNQKNEIKGNELQIKKDKNKNGYINITNKLAKDFEEIKVNKKLYYNNNYKIKLFTSNIIFIIYIIIIDLVTSQTESIFSNITIRIKGHGTKNILSAYFFRKNINFLDKIYINRIENTIKNYSYYLNQK